MPLQLLIAVCILVVVLFAALIAILSRYRKCPADKILVIYGKVGSDKNGQTRQMHSRRRGVHRAGHPVVPVPGSDADLDQRRP